MRRPCTGVSVALLLFAATGCGSGPQDPRQWITVTVDWPAAGQAPTVAAGSVVIEAWGGIRYTGKESYSDTFSSCPDSASAVARCVIEPPARGGQAAGQLAVFQKRDIEGYPTPTLFLLRAVACAEAGGAGEKLAQVGCDAVCRSGEATSVAVTLVEPVTEIELHAPYLVVGSSCELGATPKSASGAMVFADLEWATSNQLVLWVEPQGAATALSVGEAEITVTAKSTGVTARETITVEPPPPPVHISVW